MKLAKVYPLRSVEIVSGHSILVKDNQDKEYIDLIQGNGAGILGHTNGAWLEKFEKQLNKLTICAPTLDTPIKSELLDMFKKILPVTLNSVFFSNSGTESVETAIKLARKYTGKSKIIAMKRGYHGKTLGSLALTWKKDYRAGYALGNDVSHVRFNDLEDLRNAVDDGTAAVILELIQGEGGLSVADITYVENLRKLCSEKNILLILDEVQTFLRTGKHFAFEHYNIVPDILCISKALGNGFPIGATIANEELMDAFGIMGHTNTFGGNPMACAAALATLEIVETENLIKHSQDISAYFNELVLKTFTGRDFFSSIKGKGLMVGIELTKLSNPYVKKATELGLLVLPASTVLRLLPPINISKEDVDLIVQKLSEVFADV